MSSWCIVIFFCFRNQQLLEHTGAAVSETRRPHVLHQLSSLGKHRHCHPPQHGHLTAIRVRVEAKEKAVGDIYKSSASIVEEAQQKHINPDKPGGRQNQATLVRMANRTRELLRSKEPRSLDFELDENFLP
ncbi:uncharacterized protein LOC124267332 [Haliotis rubra]|uniref:uncharacterized protein LOC124267332 n=1 Tax=Haliotis rubra TaxID=36100 RepID=UPI001EE4FBCE|nr:uncharacterized protein LOC124267332 [Haliotis rubra]